MAGLYTFPMSAWITFANQVAESSLERMQEMTEAIQKREYKPSDLYADALGFWMDGVNGWWSVIQQTAAGPVPYGFVKMRSDDESACCEVPARRCGSGELKWTDLARLGDGGSGESLTVTATWANDKPNCIVAEAHGLDVAKVKAGARLKKGLYQTSVHMDEKLVAIVQILVED